MAINVRTVIYPLLSPPPPPSLIIPPFLRGTEMLLSPLPPLPSLFSFTTKLLNDRWHYSNYCKHKCNTSCQPGCILCTVGYAEDLQHGFPNRSE